MGRLNLDGHKLQYHPEYVSGVLKDHPVTPIYVEISPAANCNHHCLFCHYNYLGHKGKFPEGRMLSLIDELAKANVKSLVFAGIGEPTLNKETVPAIEKAKSLGIDVAMSTNGALLKEKDLDVLAASLTWIRFSFNAGGAENYALVHQTKASDYDKVIENMEKLKAVKEKTGSPITIGTQFILLPENKDFVLEHARRMKEIGVDYFVVKHFYEHEANEYQPDMGFLTYDLVKILQEEATKMSDDRFKFIVRSLDNLEKHRVYTKCYGLPLIVYIREDGNLYTCFSYQHDEGTVLGNVFEQSFQEIWAGDGRQNALGYINNCIDKNHCQPNCRHHQINNYLWELKHPTMEHLNFI